MRRFILVTTVTLGLAACSTAQIQTVLSNFAPRTMVSMTR